MVMVPFPVKWKTSRPAEPPRLTLQFQTAIRDVLFATVFYF
jgi:hypothetical protein